MVDFYFNLEYSQDMENILNTESQGTHESYAPANAPDSSDQKYPQGGERENHRNHEPAKEPGTPEKQ